MALFQLETARLESYLALDAVVASPFRGHALARFGALLPEPWPPRAV